MTPGCRGSCCRQWTTPSWQRMALSKRFSREAVYVFCGVTEKKTGRRDKTRLNLRTWWCWLLSQPQDQIAQKEEAQLAACTFWWQNLYFCIWTDAGKSYQPKLLQKWQTARVRNGTLKKDVRYIFRSSLFFSFLGQTWAENLGPWHWRLRNIAVFLQSKIRIGI